MSIQENSVPSNITRVRELFLQLDDNFHKYSSEISKHSQSSNLNEEILEISIDSCKWHISLHPKDSSSKYITEVGSNTAIQSQCQVIIDSDTFLSLLSGKANPIGLFMSGKVKLTGNRKLFQQFNRIFKSIQSKVSMNSTTIVTISTATILRIFTKHGYRLHKPLNFYVINVVGMKSSQSISWQVSRRFSEFILLRKKLIQIDNEHSIQILYPQISHSSDLFVSTPELLAYRKRRLQSFLDDVLSRLASYSQSSTHLINQFLNAHQNSGDIPSHDISQDMLDMSHPIQCKPGSFEVVSTLLRDQQLQRSNIKVKVNILHEQIIEILWFTGKLVINLGLFISFTCLCNFAISSSDPSMSSNTIFKISPYEVLSWSIVAALVYHPGTRFTAVSALVSTFNISSQFKSPLLLIVYDYIQPMSHLSSTIADFCDALVMLIYQLSSRFPLFPILVMLTSAMIISIFNKFERLIHVYTLGFSLIFLYLTLKIICVVLFLPLPIQDTLYDKVDHLVAPIVVYHIRHLKSLFIKFAQYFGGRSDIMSPVWCEALSSLQDACDASSPDYVRISVESTFGKRVEDIFEEFDWVPVASASIAQVHYATLKKEYQSVSLLPLPNESLIRPSTMSMAPHEDLTSDENGSQDSGRPTLSSSSFALRPSVTTNPSSTQVVVKVQHENIAALMNSDVRAVLFMLGIAAQLDPRWKLSIQVLENWKKTMNDELNFNTEGCNLVDVSEGLSKGGLQCLVPAPIRGLCGTGAMVMTRLQGFKVTDAKYLSACGIDREALVSRIAHCSAHQLLVMGVFNGDPHAGNLFVCPSASNPNECVPGLLDFGMTVRITTKQRLAYCNLIVGLSEGDIERASQSLSEIGYATNQKSRVPERDAEFFMFLLRNAQPKSVAKEENKQFFTYRDEQKKEDLAQGVREKAGRQIDKLPDEFLFLARVIGLLRGLTAELDISCPILQILEYHARLGLKNTNG